MSKDTPVEIMTAAAPRFSLWRWLGFGTCRARFEDNEHPELCESYMLTDVMARLDWRDRLRLVFSGQMMISVATKTDVLVRHTISRSTVSVLPPRWSSRP